jgi:hypothetical protein
MKFFDIKNGDGLFESRRRVNFKTTGCLQYERTHVF